MSVFKSKALFSQKNEKKQRDLEKSEKCDVYVYYTTGEKPDPILKAKIKIYESSPNSSRIEVDNKLMILDCDYKQAIIEKEMIGQSWLGWFAGFLIFLCFDIYRMLHELVNFTWSVGIADVIFLMIFGIIVCLWSISLSEKTYKEMNLIFDETTGTYSSFIINYQVRLESESLLLLWTLLEKMKLRFESMKNSFWVSVQIEKLIIHITLKIKEIIFLINNHAINPTDLNNCWEGLDDLVNIFETDVIEVVDIDELEKAKSRKAELLKIIYTTKEDLKK